MRLLTSAVTLAASLLLLLPQPVSAETAVITPPCETTLYYSIGTVQLTLNNALSYSNIEIYRIQEEGEFRYYSYDCGLIEDTCLEFSLIEGDYILYLTTPSDLDAGTDIYEFNFTIEDPDLDSDLSFDSMLYRISLTCDPDSNLSSVTFSEAGRIRYADAVWTLPRQSFVHGDLYEDGEINANDATLLLLESAALGAGNPQSLTSLQIAEADVNMDGSMNASDATVILMYAASHSAGNFPGTLTEFAAQMFS